MSRPLTKSEMKELQRAAHVLWRGVQASCAIEGEGVPEHEPPPQVTLTQEEAYNLAVSFGIIEE